MNLAVRYSGVILVAKNASISEVGFLSCLFKVSTPVFTGAIKSRDASSCWILGHFNNDCWYNLLRIFVEDLLRIFFSACCRLDMY